MGFALGLLLKLAPVLLPKLLGLFGIKLGPESDLQAGERLGQAETQASIAKKELTDAQKAVGAGDAADASDAADGVRKPHAGDRKWDPDGLG